MIANDTYTQSFETERLSGYLDRANAVWRTYLEEEWEAFELSSRDTEPSIGDFEQMELALEQGAAPRRATGSPST